MSYFVNPAYAADDANGNVSVLVDSADSLRAHYEYSPFGEVINSSGDLADENVYTFSTKYQDSSGLLYYGYRFYDAVDGRWMNRDPIEEFGGLNLYGFVENKATGESDYLGLLVTASFDITTGVLTVTDDDTGESITLCAESGGKPHGKPIPTGKYEILERAGKAEFYRLDAKDRKPRNDTHEPTGRNKFRLHKPGLTVGCIAALYDCVNCWKAVDALLQKTKTTTVNATSLRVGMWLRGPAKEKLKMYGVLTVTESVVADDEEIEKCKCNCPEDKEDSGEGNIIEAPGE